MRWKQISIHVSFYKLHTPKYHNACKANSHGIYIWCQNGRHILQFFVHVHKHIGADVRHQTTRGWYFIKTLDIPEDSPLYSDVYLTEGNLTASTKSVIRVVSRGTEVPQYRTKLLHNILPFTYPSLVCRTHFPKLRKPMHVFWNTLIRSSVPSNYQ